MGAEQLVAAGPERDPLDGRDERLEVVASPPGRSPLCQRADLMRARGLVQADLDLDPLLQVVEVERIGDGVCRDGLSEGVDTHLSGTAIPRQRNEGGGA